MAEAAPKTGGPPAFDRVSRLYRWAEYIALGPSLRRTREHFLSALPATGTALVLGDGDGRFTAALLRAWPSLQVTAVDASGAMLHLLQARCRFASGRLQTRQADIRDLAPILAALPSCDLIVSHFVLDCLTPPELATLARHLRQSVAPGAVWLVSDFAIPHRQPWKTLGDTYIRGLYLAFRVLTGLRVQRLPPITQALTGAGWTPRRRYTRLGGLLFSELWQPALSTTEVGFRAPDATTPEP